MLEAKMTREDVARVLGRELTARKAWPFGITVTTDDAEGLVGTVVSPARTDRNGVVYSHGAGCPAEDDMMLDNTFRLTNGQRSWIPWFDDDATGGVLFAMLGPGWSARKDPISNDWTVEQDGDLGYDGTTLAEAAARALLATWEVIV